MYLVDSQEFADLASRDQGRAISSWLKATRPGRLELFVSALSIGIVAQTIEDLPQTERGHWRRLLSEARRSFIENGAVIPVDLQIVDTWASSLRGVDLFYEDESSGYREPLGEDTRLVLATAIARGLTLVSRSAAHLDVVCERTTLTVVNP
jgi:predicted nucleic acid-binding protein